jgi:hypothetical protein
MNKVFRFGGLAALACAWMIGTTYADEVKTSSVRPATVTAPSQSGTCKLGEIEAVDSRLVPMALFCGTYDGTPCTTPGEKFRCLNGPNEPGRCVCTVNHVYTCG